MTKLRLVKPSFPRTSTEVFKEVEKVLKTGSFAIPTDRAYKGTGGPGRYLETLLGLKGNNADSPDLKDWEVKFHGGQSLVTLFHKEAEPRGIMQYIVHEHGWRNDKGQLCFRHTISGKSDRGFYVVNQPDRITVRFDGNKDTPSVFWKHNTLMGSAGSKLRRLIVVEGKMSHHPTRSVVYKKATAYWDFNLTGFCELVAKGTIKIDFDARTTKGAHSTLRNHGTKFRIKEADIASLYEHSKKITTGKG